MFKKIFFSFYVLRGNKIQKAPKDLKSFVNINLGNNAAAASNPEHFVFLQVEAAARVEKNYR